jgi:hypothetical protein
MLSGLAVAAGLGFWRVGAPRQVWPSRSVRGTPDWHQRVLEKLHAAEVDLETVDRIELLALEPSDIDVDPHGLGTIGLGALSSHNLTAEHARMDELGRRYRGEHTQRLFPTGPRSRPEHPIVASRVLEGEEARKFLALWRGQAMDCEPEGRVWCHSPNFGLRLYSGQRYALEISLCWTCQTAKFFVDGESLQCDFAVQTRAARTLRKALKSHFPTVRTEEELVPKISFDWQ